MSTKIYVGNAMEVLPKLEAESVHCSVSSPPYYGLRKYSGSQQCEWPEIEYSPMSGLPPIQIPGCAPDCEHEWAESPRAPTKNARQGSTETEKWPAIVGTGKGSASCFCQKCGGWRGALGNEPNLEMYIGHLVAIYREVYRVLREDGVVFVVMGDSYAGSGKGPTGFNGIGNHEQRQGFHSSCIEGQKQGNLMMVPHRLALALQADGWIVRNDLVWKKVAPMPESVKGWTWQKHRIKVKSGRYDSEEKQSVNPMGAGFNQRCRGEEGWAAEWTDCPGCPKCEANDGYILKRGSWRHTRSHEFVIHMVKKMGYYADQEKVREESIGNSGWARQRAQGAHHQRKLKSGFERDASSGTTIDTWTESGSGRNPRSVLTPKPEPFPGSHFAVYPTSLITNLIKATCPDKCCPECRKGWAPIVKKQKAAVTNPRPFSKPGNEGDRNDVGRIYEETTSNVLGYRPTCECGCEESSPGTCLDPFAGSGTTGLVCERLGLNSVLIEIGSDYSEMARDRIVGDAPLLNRVEVFT